MTNNENNDKEPKAKADLDLEETEAIEDLAAEIEELELSLDLGQEIKSYKMERPGPWPDRQNPWRRSSQKSVGFPV